MILKQNTARNRVFSFIGVSITTLSVTISKDGGEFDALSGTLSNITGSFYKVALNTTDTNTLGDLAYAFSDSILGTIAPNGGNVDEVGSGSDLLTMVFEGSETFQDFLREARAVLYGKGTNLNTPTPKFRDLADTKNRVDSSIVNGVRTNTIDPS